ncbi:hypothetical protein B9Z55_018293 [Caenorhabditis nigoni]|uniref:Uncharacterized protein n=1 Tax=Caenorhabditis nigoni TaxID=1611254 RepID=A0A2G5TE40_9PELO|nr:hypothetical protein B9Z55_018293 [Caenorhabditis nigoni]
MKKVYKASDLNLFLQFERQYEDFNSNHFLFRQPDFSRYDGRFSSSSESSEGRGGRGGHGHGHGGRPRPPRPPVRPRKPREKNNCPADWMIFKRPRDNWRVRVGETTNYRNYKQSGFCWSIYSSPVKEQS